VASLARPGGNTTGSTILSPEINAKRMELLKEAIPRIRRVAALMNPANPLSELVFKQMGLTARALGIELRPAWVRRGDELDSAFSELVKARIDGLVILEDAVLVDNVRRIADLAKKHRLPTAAGSEHVQTGSLLSYGVDFVDLWRRAATFVDKILKGTKPADIPVEQPMKFTLVVNLKTAKALGLTVQRSVLVRADRVIQ
jgi:putative ABC transport system substrate-binding protein